MGIELDLLRLGPIEATVGAWLLTYVVHATLLVIAVALVTRWRRVRSDALRETLWKCALVGGVLTASVQLAVGGGIVGEAWTFAVDDEVVGSHVESPRFDAPTSEGTLVSPTALGERTANELAGAEIAPMTGTTRAIAPGTRRAPSNTALVLLLAPALLGLLLLAWRWRHFRGMIARRTCIADGEARDRLDLLRARAGLRRRVRLSSSDALTVPVAFGILRPEICLPARALEELSASSLESMLAHELAHHVRRDPLWLAGWRVGEALFFVQPLNRWARRRWQEVAEYRADALAARLTGNGLPLARCLTEVATWLVEARRQRQSTFVPGMAERRSGLERRIARLCAGNHDGPHHPRPWHALAAGVLLATAALVAPGFATMSAPSAPAAAPPHVAPLPLPLPDALPALGSELAALHAELDALRATLRDQGTDPAQEQLLDEIAARSRGLLSRRLEIEHQEANPNPVRPGTGR